MTGMFCMQNIINQYYDYEEYICLCYSTIICRSPGTSVMVSSILMGLILIGRAAFVFPLSFISNLTRKMPHEKIGIKQQV